MVVQNWLQHTLNSLKTGAALALSASLLAIAPTLLTPQPPPVLAHTDWISSWVDDLKLSNERWIQIDLSEQVLTAWEGDSPVYSVLVSTGLGSDATPVGVYAIQSMHEIARMQGDDYDIPDVPYVMYFEGNYAIHGAYWHDNFGDPVSRGCVNVATDHAEWLFYWASLGTTVVVQD